MDKLELHLEGIITRGYRPPESLRQSFFVSQRRVFDILHIPQLKIEVGENGTDYLVMGQSGHGKSIFLRTLFSLLNGKEKFDVPGNTPCLVEGKLEKKGNFSVSFGDEWGSDIAVNQFERGVGSEGPRLHFRIAHDFESLDIHRRREMPIIFIHLGKVLFCGPVHEFLQQNHDAIVSFRDKLLRLK